MHLVRRCDSILKEETYDDYLKKASSIPGDNIEWIKQVINNNSESERIIYSDDKFLLIPPKKWYQYDKKKMHLLAFVKDINIRSLRDLRGHHVPLLKHILNTSLDVIEKECNIQKNKIRTYIHYHPSTWVLHIHFNTVEHMNVSCSVEYSHNLYDVIKNLELCDEYYSKYIMYVYE